MENKVLKTSVIKKHIKGQGTLETVIIFVIIILFLGGITKIWLWANNQIVRRQLRYNASRVAAGFSTDTYTLQWPYPAENLTVNDVLLDSPLNTRGR